MFCEKGDFLHLEDGPILEVVYADEEKAVCLTIEKRERKWGYGRACVISNNSEKYEGKKWVTKGEKPSITRKTIWAPLREAHTYWFN